MPTAGVNNNGKFEAFATYGAIFLANLLYLLPKGAFPNILDVYDSLLRSLFATIVIWLTNKGISWRAKPEGST